MIATMENPPAARSNRVYQTRIATTCGMDPDARAALTKIEELARAGGRVAVAGRFMPDAGVSARLAALGVQELVAEPDFFRFRHLVIPFTGISPQDRRAWTEAGHLLTDLSSPHFRRAQVALGLLRMEGAQPLVIGRHDDPESLALAAVSAGTRILQDTTDTARLTFAPAFGAVCQTTLSPRKVAWLVAQLRMRYRDATVTFLNTTAPGMTVREQALENILANCEAAVIVGEPGEASVEALVETAMRKGKPALVATDAAALDRAALGGIRRIALSAGAFATDDAVCGVYQALKSQESPPRSHPDR
jgi:4-hydroxy-3-methylbut-2-enyl diphosphate reductase IspH